MESEIPVVILREERETGIDTKHVLPVGFLSLYSCLRKNIDEKGSSKEKTNLLYYVLKMFLFCFCLVSLHSD